MLETGQNEQPLPSLKPTLRLPELDKNVTRITFAYTIFSVHHLKVNQLTNLLIAKYG
jgi:hypothetical protein